MQALGFNKSFIHLIMRYISSVSYSFIINVVKKGFLYPKRRIRQGDPVSFYLFLLCAEGLSLILSDMEARKQITRIRIARACPPFSHLFFADDSLLFTKATKKEAISISKELVDYSTITGQEINFDKLAVCFSPNTTRRSKRKIAKILKIQEVACHERYWAFLVVYPKRRCHISITLKIEYGNIFKIGRSNFFLWDGKKFL